MRVALISHSYLHHAPRGKLRALGALPDVDLCAIVPRRWPFRPQGWVEAVDSGDREYRLISLPTLLTGKEGLSQYVGLAHVLREIRPDVIHVEHGSAALSFTQVLWLKWILGLPAKTVLFSWWNLGSPLRFPLNWTERLNLWLADAAIAGNADAARILRSRGYHGPLYVFPLWGIDPEQWSRAPDSECRDLREQLGMEENDFVVGYAGRFIAQKGLLDLVAAAGRLPPVARLLLVGEGSLRPEILRLAGQEGLRDRLCIVDTVPHDELPRYLSIMDVLVLPSHTTPSWREQFGHVLVEAMACQTPVVGSDSGEIPNVIGDAGLVFGEQSVDGLAERLQRLLDSPELCRELAARGRLRALESFTDEQIAKRTYQVWIELAGAT